MGQRSNDAAVMDVQIKFKMEECVLGMEQRSNGAALKDAQVDPKEEDYARDMVHTATIKKNLQLSHHVWGQNLIRLR